MRPGTPGVELAVMGDSLEHANPRGREQVPSTSEAEFFLRCESPDGESRTQQRGPSPSFRDASRTSLHSDDTRSFLPQRQVSGTRKVASDTDEHGKGTEKDAYRSFWEAAQAMDWWWWWEIGATTLGIACVAAIAGVLIYINNRTIDQWTFGIAPNSLIAIMTTISKAAMMVPIASCISQLKWDYFSKRPRPIKDLELFDTASRGPWGSICFLSLMRTQAITASALAIVTVLALGVEPTAQQILELSSRRWDSPGNNNVRLPIASSYTSKKAAFEGIDPTSTFEQPATSDILFQQASIARGVAGDIPSLEVNCPSPAVECMWERFNTLGVCTTVQNVTDSIKPACSSADKGSFDKGEATCVFDFALIRNSSLVGPTILVPPPFNETEVAPAPITMRWSFNDGGIPGDFNYFESVGSTGINNGGSNLDIVRYKFDPDWKYATDGMPKTANPQPMEAWNIQWYWCSHWYSDVVATPTGIQSFKLETESVYRDPDVDRKGVYVANKTNVQYRFNPETWTTSHFQASEVALFKYISHAFTDQIYENTFLIDQHDNNRILSLGRFMYGADIPRLAQNVADTLSVLVRQNSSGDNLDSTYHYGNASYTATYYHVRWGWLVLPLAEAILTAILLAVAILRARSQPLLKSSQLALVSYGIEARGQEQLALTKPARSATALETEVGKKRVRLTRNETGNIGFIGS
ncbi:uncharacterized protein JN550_011600 [Neoarthrinium moseri]|uniref:uncharacterized protein n=1 Tax=Neoarthrinium moseri TaxID=1658444 RepID=UPI001FDE46B4|nr:uncharacterized protein JN550_011600 [Neoarthrinium moseri]KAI1860334.1 hypothetical protein JN550_011600 [Neoarthrinium moseri]